MSPKLLLLCPLNQPFGRLFAAALTCGAFGVLALPMAAQESAPDQKQVTLLYTVNNLGYSETCG